jgi:hypothetical protein
MARVDARRRNRSHRVDGMMERQWLGHVVDRDGMMKRHRFRNVMDRHAVRAAGETHRRRSSHGRVV